MVGGAAETSRSRVDIFRTSLWLPPGKDHGGGAENWEGTGGSGASRAHGMTQVLETF